MSYTVRPLQPADVESLTRFFSKAYGAQTIFSSRRFLNWFFGSAVQHDDNFECMVALDGGNEIVAHYGTLDRRVLYFGAPKLLRWGVSAYTLEDHRGQGLGAQLLQPLIENCDIFGVIGFNPRTADFYEKLGFNLFGRRRFVRWVQPISQVTFDIVDQIGADRKAAEALLTIAPSQSKNSIPTNMVEDWSGYRGDYSYADLVTTDRSHEAVDWRFARCPAAEYHLMAIVSAESSAHVIYRREKLQPLEYCVTRVVDLYGDAAAIGELLQALANRAARANDAYIDFSCMGDWTETIMRDAGYSRLQGSEVELLPMVTTPISLRQNNEFLGLVSHNNSAQITRLDPPDLFFTRADSDRDRPVRLSQMKD